MLLKPGKLTADEFDQVKVHAEAGATILADTRSDVLRMRDEIVRLSGRQFDPAIVDAFLRLHGR